MRYKNISDFHQSIILNGSKRLLRPDDVFETDRELNFIFLERVDDSTPVTLGEKSSSTIDKVKTDLEKEIEELKKEKESTSIATSDEIKELISKLTVSLEENNKHTEEVSQTIDEEIRELRENLVSLKEIFSKNKELMLEKDKEVNDKIQKAFKRLEMTKHAIITLENVVHGDDEGN